MENGESIIIDDFGEEPELSQSNLNSSVRELVPAHTGIRSAMMVPITIQDQVVGLIDLHARNPHAFDEASRQISETLAVQAAIAIGNAHRYREQVLRSEELNRRLDTLSRLHETSQTLRNEITLEEALDSIALAIQSATPFEVVLISVFDPEKNTLRRVSGAGLAPDTLDELRAHQQPWQAVFGLLREEFCLGQAYFIPSEQMPILPDEIHSITLLEEDQSQSESSGWHPDDALLVPLLREDGSPLGLVSVDAPRNNLRPDRPSIESLEIFASQAALAIEVQQRIEMLQSRIEHAEQASKQAEDAADAARQNLPALLHKDLEQTLAIRELSERARRIQAGLEIAENVNRRGSRGEVLAALGEEILGKMEMDLALVAEMSVDGPRLLYTLGTVPPGLKPDALLGQRNPLRQGLQQRQIVLVSDLDETPEWQNAPLLYALNCKGFVCLPIIAQNQPVAAVLAISRSPLAAFNDDDKKLYQLLAKQVAMTLQNLNLLEVARRRLRESNMLMDFGRQLGGLDPVGILPVLAANSLQVVPSARAAMVAIWNPRTGLLQPEAAVGYANIESLVKVTYQIGEGLPGRVFAEGKPVRIGEIEFARDYHLPSEKLLHYRDATAGALPVSSMLVPITAGPQAEPLGILVLDNFTTPQAFTLEDETLITTLTQQTALTLENARLYQAAEKRAQELQALTNVAATITASLEPGELVATLLDQLQEILPYDTGTLWLRQSDQLLVQAERGFLDDESRVGLSVAIEDSLLLKEMIETGQPISVPNVRDDPRFPSLIPYTRISWLGLPLIASGEVIGVIALEKVEPNYYSHDQIQIAKTFSSQAAVGLANASMYQESVQRAVELDERSQRLAALNRLSGELSSSLDPVQILQVAVKELYQTITCSAVSGLLFENVGQIFLRAEYPVTGLELPFAVPDSPLFEWLRESLGVYSCEDVNQEPGLEQLAVLFERFQTCGLLILPITTGGDLHGLMLAHEAGPHRFEADEVELALTVSNQVAIAVQNAQLFEQTRSLTEDLEERVNQRTSELAREHQRIEILLRIITELSASLDLSQVLSRTLGVLNEILDAEQITVLITRDSGHTLHRIASVGYTAPTPEEGAATPFTAGEGLAGWVITNRKATLIDDVLQDDRWVQLPGTPNEHRSALAVPLMIGAEALGTMLLFHPQAAHFSPEHLDLVQAAGNQVAVAVNNAELYRLIRDQAEDLGIMLRNQQVETSRSKAILEAVADGVLVTDFDKRVTLFNPSAEEILGLDRSQVQGKSLEHFIGLFGRAARSWMQTIDAWSQDPEIAQDSETYAEQITLENGKVVAVRLSPVSMRNDFLGTVSIFQDITHQVEVDRLKSEFVATVSHELRTPMTSIKGYVEVLLMGAAGDMNEQQTRFLEVVKDNTDRLTVLVNDLLDISRIESGRIVLSRQALDLQEVVDQAMMDLSLRSREDEKPVKIYKEIGPGLPRVYGDLERVLQIMGNLLDNAYHYNTAEGHIIIRASTLGKQVQIDVIDTGVGIPPEEQSRVFERFYRGESPLILGVSGTGLGLSIVQSLVSMHGGEIWLESTGVMGEGSKFSFTLPIYTPLEEMKVPEYGEDFNRR
jgi:PAS domain S-box-containing protein